MGASGNLSRSAAANQRLTLGFGHRRLAIFDLSAAGNQPMGREGRAWVVFNGEIYNFLELRRELKGKGYAFSTGTDTEVLLAAYLEWGEDCVRRFNGMWAFALYDVEREVIFFSRDRLGIKPLYYGRREQGFFFASEIKALLVGLDEPAVIAPGPLAGYLVHGLIDDGEETIYEGVRELRGGWSATLDLRTLECKQSRYWSLPSGPRLDLDDARALDEFCGIFEDAVRIRLRADVPVAVSLSGGVDSSAVTVAASRVSGVPVRAFTSSFPQDPAIDESQYAAHVAGATGAEAHLVEPRFEALGEQEPLMARHQELPYGSLSLFVHWSIMERIREQGIPVVLSGQGGDELFLGYERYLVARVLSRGANLPAAAWDLVTGCLNSRLRPWEAAGFLLYFGFPRLRHRVRRRRLAGWLNPRLPALAPSAREYVSADLSLLQERELTGGQLSSLLRYDDRNAAAHGMETRLPFLDYRLVEFGFRLPWRCKIRNGWSKWLVRQYLARHGLARIAWRRRKLGFNAPQAHWASRLWQEHGTNLWQHPLRRELTGAVMGDAFPRRVPWALQNLLELARACDWRGLQG